MAYVRERLSGFGAEACLAKAVVVNSLYSTNVYAIFRMAAPIGQSMRELNARQAGCEFADRIALLPAADGKRFMSFASRFCHHFVAPERFPIYDWYACRALNMHLGKGVTHKWPDYASFAGAVEALRKSSGLACSPVELDRYLWLRGQHEWYTQRTAAGKHHDLSAEVTGLFRLGEHDAEIRALLATLAGRQAEP